MNKKIIIFLSAFFVFGLVAVFAFNTIQITETAAKTNAAATESAHKSDHCKMKKNAASDEGEKSCCGMADCCKDGNCQMSGSCCSQKSDSCPMKKMKESKNDSETVKADMTNVTIAKGESCCQPGASCCDGGACCKKEKN